MLKHTNNFQQFTSFHGTEIEASFNELVEFFPHSWKKGGDGKTNFNFILEDEEGNNVTIYDYKLYRPIQKDEKIIWNIGARNKEISDRALSELKRILNRED